MAERWHLQNQFPVEEVKIDIMFKCKLCIYNIYIKHMHIAITQKILAAFENILKNLYAHNILFRNAKKKYQQLWTVCCEIFLRTLECSKL
jgi:hypothetical protein